MSNMDLHLGRFDLATVGANQRDTMKVMPSAKANKRQKVVIGDDSGVVHCFTVKKGETQALWKSTPGRREVSALCLGGARGSKDKVYVAYGQTIAGLNKKKGQSFFQYQTDLNEDIRFMFVEEMTIWTACEYILNVFESSKTGEKVADTHFFMAADKINHLCMSPISSPLYYNPILACHDKHIRIIRDSELLLQQKVGGPVMALTIYTSEMNPIPTSGDDIDADGNPKTYKQLLYGTDAGTFGQVLVDGQSIRQGWTASNRDNRAGISAMTQVELTGTGVPDVVIGRDDGTIEVYAFDMSSEPQQQFMRELNESITSIDTGLMVGIGQHDIIVSTYSGKLLTYTGEIKSNIAHIAPKKPESAASSLLSKMKAAGDKNSSSISTNGSSSNTGLFSSNDATSTAIASGVSTSSALIGADGKSNPHEDAERTVCALRSELDVLRTKVEQAREKFSKISSEMIAVEQQFKIKSSFKLLPSEACYMLTLEIPIPLDVVTLQSNVPVMLLDVDSNKAMVSRTVADQKNENELLATYRCQDSTNRIEIKVRTVEGQHGSLNAYIIPKLTPKTCQKCVLSIKPLSLHEKVAYEQIAQLVETRPLNTLTITGSFTLTEIHMWIANSLPDVAPRAASDDAQLCFQSTFLHTILVCDYSKGKGVFRSDSITAISILKEVMTKDATNKKISINVKVDLNPDSVYTFLNLLRPALDHHFSLSRRHDLIEPLKELATHEPQTDYLSPEYREILEKAEDIKAEVKVAPRHLDFLRGIVTDLFVDKHKLSGLSAESKIAGLLDVLKNYDFQKLVTQFQQI